MEVAGREWNAAISANVLVSLERTENMAVENAAFVAASIFGGLCGVVGCVGDVERIADG